MLGAVGWSMKFVQDREKAITLTPARHLLEQPKSTLLAKITPASVYSKRPQTSVRRSSDT